MTFFENDKGVAFAIVAAIIRIQHHLCRNGGVKRDDWMFFNFMESKAAKRNKKNRAI